MPIFSINIIPKMVVLKNNMDGDLFLTLIPSIAPPNQHEKLTKE
jgi:hypothetical protein